MTCGRSKTMEWLLRKHGEPTPVQAEAWPQIAAGRHVLVASPTGTGKTMAAFLGVLESLERERVDGVISAVYVSPLRALGYDLEKNLAGPLREIYGEAPPIQVALRTGDTGGAERVRQARKPPHILLTTPESLCVLLSQEKWAPVLAGVRWVIVDELHALAENKRGAHLSLSLERLSVLVGGEGPQRIGLSATVAPMKEVASFLGGEGRDVVAVEAASGKRVEIAVHTPLREEPYPAAGFTGFRLMEELGGLIAAHRTTLVFCNTRSGAEATTFWLREHLPELAGRIACHHASLDRDVRREVEDQLKAGELRAVVCSTSLELGIDIGAIELVVMMATPKGVSRALQRAGRAGHDIRSVSRGILMATNVGDLVEACATARLSRSRQLDVVRIPCAPLDVLAQHLVGMGCHGPQGLEATFALVRRARPYRDLSEGDFADVLEYLAGGGKALRAQYAEVFGKIELGAETFVTRAGRVRRDFLQNIGAIPEQGSVAVVMGGRHLGTVEEMFLRGLKTGDVFLMAGRCVRLEKMQGMKARVVDARRAQPTVPRWNANKMPLSNRIAEEIGDFRAGAAARVCGDDAAFRAWIAERLECGESNARVIAEVLRAQAEVSRIPTREALLIEEMDGGPTTGGRVWYVFVHALIGRTANDALSRVVARRLCGMKGGNAVATPDDYGFVLVVGEGQRFGAEEARALFRAAGMREDLEDAIGRSELFKYHFRNAAQTGLMVYRNYFGARKPLRKLQWSAEVIFEVLLRHEPDHVLLREARRDVAQTFLDVEGAERFARELEGRTIDVVRVDRVPPLSFAMYASKIREVLVVEDPRETLERLYNVWWEEIRNGGSSQPAKGGGVLGEVFEPARGASQPG